MVIKRVNSTGRRRIPRDRVAIEVSDGTPRSFTAEIDLADFDLPPDAAVVLEATSAGSNTIQRYEWGSVAELQAPSNRLLSGVSGKNIFFTMKVIDRSQRFGRILGLAENIRPIKGGNKTETGRRGILPVELADLDQELWRLDFRAEDVFLLVNSAAPELAERVRFDPVIYSLIYPGVIREVLLRALQEQPDSEDDDERWPTLWLRFARTLHPDQEAPPEEDAELQDEWITAVVTTFCQQHSLRDQFIRATGGRNWEDTL